MSPNLLTSAPLHLQVSVPTHSLPSFCLDTKRSNTLKNNSLQENNGKGFDGKTSFEITKSLINNYLTADYRNNFKRL